MHVSIITTIVALHSCLRFGRLCRNTISRFASRIDKFRTDVILTLAMVRIIPHCVLKLSSPSVLHTGTRIYLGPVRDHFRLLPATAGTTTSTTTAGGTNHARRQKPLLVTTTLMPVVVPLPKAATTPIPPPAVVVAPIMLMLPSASLAVHQLPFIRKGRSVIHAAVVSAQLLPAATIVGITTIENNSNLLESSADALLFDYSAAVTVTAATPKAAHSGTLTINSPMADTVRQHVRIIPAIPGLPTLFGANELSACSVIQQWPVIDL